MGYKETVPIYNQNELLFLPFVFEWGRLIFTNDNPIKDQLVEGVK